MVKGEMVKGEVDVLLALIALLAPACRQNVHFTFHNFTTSQAHNFTTCYLDCSHSWAACSSVKTRITTAPSESAVM